MNGWAGKRVTLMGLGRHGGGVGAARWLAAQGALVTVTDLADAGALADSLAALADVPIARYRLGGHDRDDFRHAQAVVLNPAVRPGDPCVELARRSGATITSEMELFLRLCPAQTVGVTGSNGKSTTAAMIAAIFAADGRRCWLGGNIGRSLLPDVERIAPDDVVVLELSSFQLWQLSPGTPLPQIAVVTNCTSNHLDWHGDYGHYRAAKQRMVAEQDEQCVAVLNVHDVEVRTWAPLVRGKLVEPLPVEALPPLAIPGRHNRLNAACAAAAARAAGCSPEAVAAGLSAFRALEHRLELIAEVSGRQFFNDSKSTTPEASLAALEAFDAPVWLLAGGLDKGCEWGRWADVAAGLRGVALFGNAAARLATEIAKRTGKSNCHVASTLDEALAWCWRQSQPGDVVLLSPACASFDQFADYTARGRHFTELVRSLAQAAPR